MAIILVLGMLRFYAGTGSAGERVACRLYERHGMKIKGTVASAGGLIPGLVYRLTSKARFPL